jgi:hypothetical protein
MPAAGVPSGALATLNWRMNCYSTGMPKRGAKPVGGDESDTIDIIDAL